MVRERGWARMRGRLVSAFAGYERVMALYAHAIRARYRFFSYGDAMLLERTL